MLKSQNKTLYQKLIDAWGVDAQILMCVEEMSELTKELCKYFREDNNSNPEKFHKLKDNICEELADVVNMTEQLIYIFGEDKVKDYRRKKLLRVEEKCNDYLQKQKNK